MKRHTHTYINELYKKNTTADNFTDKINFIFSESKKKDSNMIIQSIKNTPNSGFLLTNVKLKDPERYINENIEDLRIITYNIPLNIPEFNLKDLESIKNTKFNELIYKVWNIDESKYLNILQNIIMVKPLLPYNRFKSDLNEFSKNTCEIFNIPNNKYNLNTLNNITDKHIQNTTGISNKQYNIEKKFYFLNKLYMKKYILLFYDYKINDIKTVQSMYKYDYILNAIDNKDERAYATIKKECFKKYNQIKDQKQEIYKYEQMHDILKTIFDNKDDNFEFKEVINQIKDFFSPGNEIVKICNPEKIFINDLINLKLNFDVPGMNEYYKKLSEDIKRKYQIKFYINKILYLYQESTKKIKNKQNKNFNIFSDSEEENEDNIKKNKKFNKIKQHEESENKSSSKNKNENKIRKNSSNNNSESEDESNTNIIEENNRTKTYKINKIKKNNKNKEENENKNNDEDSEEEINLYKNNKRDSKSKNKSKSKSKNKNKRKNKLNKKDN